MTPSAQQGVQEHVLACAALDTLDAALRGLIVALDQGGLDHLDDLGLVRFLHDFEGFRNRLSLVDHHTVNHGESRGLPAKVAQPSMRQVLVHVLRLSPAEAARRVSSAAACGERLSVLGEVLAPVRPHLAAGVIDGTLSAEQVHIIASALTKVDRPGLDSADVEAGERLLTDFAVTFGTKDLRHLAEGTVGAIDPDGTLPDDQLNADRRHFSLKPCRDGTYAGEFRLTGAAGAKLAALLQPLARPRLDTIPGANGTGSRELDGRTYGQRTHDALEEVCDRVLATGDVIGAGGTPASVIVTVTLDQLTERLGFGTTSDGAHLSVAEVLRLDQPGRGHPDRHGPVRSCPCAWPHAPDRQLRADASADRPRPRLLIS